MSIQLDPNTDPLTAGETVEVSIADTTADPKVTVVSEAGTITVELVVSGGKLVGSFVVPSAPSISVQHEAYPSVVRNVTSGEASAGA